MLTENVLIGELKNKLDINQKSIESLINNVASRQKLYIAGIVGLNILLFFLLEILSGESDNLIPGIHNEVFNLALTILLIFLPSPDAKNYGKKKIDSLKIDIEDVNPKYDYYGNWKYLTTFKVRTKNDKSKDYDLVNRSMNFSEDGTSEWKKTPLGVNIINAYTDVLKQEIERGEKPQIRWISSPAAISSNSIEWHFEGKIEKWVGNVIRDNCFVGKETYMVAQRDANDKPIKLVGDLKGFIVIDNKCYFLTAESEFNKII